MSKAKHRELPVSVALVEARRSLSHATIALMDAEQELVERQMLHVRKEAIRHAASEGLIDRVSLRRLVGEIDEQIHQATVEAKERHQESNQAEEV